MCFGFLEAGVACEVGTGDFASFRHLRHFDREDGAGALDLVGNGASSADAM
jgi:hypothetical protein